jgi:hypothetical protein
MNLALIVTGGLNLKMGFVQNHIRFQRHISVLLHVLKGLFSHAVYSS